MNLVDLKEYAVDKPEMLRMVKEINVMIESGSLDCLMFVGLDSDGRQILRTSSCSGYKKAFLVQFLNAWFSSWFAIGEP